MAGENFIGFDSELTIRREIDRVLQMHGVEVQVVMEFDNVETMKRAVEIDAGVSFLPGPSVAREVAAGSLVAVPLAVDELVRPWASFIAAARNCPARPSGSSPSYRVKDRPTTATKR